MLTELYVEALLADQELADPVWGRWNASLISDELAAAMWWTTSEGSLSFRFRALVRTMASRVSRQGRSMRVTKPQLKRDTKRSSREGMSRGGQSADSTICFRD